MKVNQNQIDRLYRFTREHFVEHYDVQTELVDHLANGIEEQWKENPDMPFESALSFEFKKFGVFGFMNVLEQKQKAMSKKYRKVFWCFFKEWFQWPKMLKTSLAVVLCFSMFQLITNPDYLRGITQFFSIGLMSVVLIRFYYIKKIHPLGEKKYLLEEMIFRAGNLVTFFNLKLQIGLSLMHSSDSFLMNPYFQFGFSSALVLGALAAYIAFWLLPQNAEALLNKTYPERKVAMV